MQLPISSECLEELRDDESDWDSNFHDHRVTESDWDAAASALAYADVTAPDGFQFRYGRENLLGAIAFAAYCEDELSPDDWEWHFDIRDSARLCHSDFSEALKFTVCDKTAVVVTTPHAEEAANPLYVYGYAASLDADFHIGGFVDSDEAYVTLFAATPVETVRETRSGYVHSSLPTCNLDERIEALMEDEPLPEHVLLKDFV